MDKATQQNTVHNASVTRSDRIKLESIKVSIGANGAFNEKRQEASSGADSTEEGSRSWSSCKSTDKQIVHTGVATDVQRTSPSRSESENNDCTSGSQPVKKRARVRRFASQLSRPFICEHNRCRRAYTTKHSRQLHYRLKHAHEDTAFSDSEPSPPTSDSATMNTKVVNNHEPQQPMIRKFPSESHIVKNLPTYARACLTRDEQDNYAIGNGQEFRRSNLPLAVHDGEWNACSNHVEGSDPLSVAATVDCSQHPFRQMSRSHPDVQYQGRPAYGPGQHCPNEAAMKYDEPATNAREYAQRFVDPAFCTLNMPGSTTEMIDLSRRTTGSNLIHSYAKREVGHARRRSHGRKRARLSRRRSGQCPVHAATLAPAAPCMGDCCQGVNNNGFAGMFLEQEGNARSMKSPRIERQASGGARYVDTGQRVDLSRAIDTGQELDYNNPYSATGTAQFHTNTVANYRPFADDDGDGCAESFNDQRTRMGPPVPLDVERRTDCPVHVHHDRPHKAQRPLMWIPVLEQTYMQSAGQYDSSSRNGGNDAPLSTTPVWEYSDVNSGGMNYHRSSGVLSDRASLEYTQNPYYHSTHSAGGNVYRTTSGGRRV